MQDENKPNILTSKLYKGTKSATSPQRKLWSLWNFKLKFIKIGGDIVFFVTLYNLEVKILSAFSILNYNQKLAKYLAPRNGQPNYFFW